MVLLYSMALSVRGLDAPACSFDCASPIIDGSSAEALFETILGISESLKSNSINDWADWAAEISLCVRLHSYLAYDLQTSGPR